MESGINMEFKLIPKKDLRRTWKLHKAYVDEETKLKEILTEISNMEEIVNQYEKSGNYEHAECPYSKAIILYSTGSKKFDSQVVIKGDIDSAEKRLLSQPKVQDQMLKALGIASNMTISINEYNVDFVPELKEKSYISIINPQEWELKRDRIEEIFRRMEKIRNIINFH